jgi:hypothetical protein
MHIYDKDWLPVIVALKDYSNENLEPTSSGFFKEYTPDYEKVSK